MKKKLIYRIVASSFIGGLLLSMPVNAKIVSGQQSNYQRANIGTVIRYFHQYQTRATGNWAPSRHGFVYGTINVRNGYAENGYSYLGTTNRSTWVTLEHKYAQNYRTW